MFKRLKKLFKKQKPVIEGVTIKIGNKTDCMVFGGLYINKASLRGF